MKAYKEVQDQFYKFLTSTLNGAEWPGLCPIHLFPMSQAPHTHYIWRCITHTHKTKVKNLSSVYAIHNVLDTKNPVGKSRCATNVLWGRGISHNGAEFVFPTEFSEATVCTSYNVHAFWKSGNIF